MFFFCFFFFNILVVVTVSRLWASRQICPQQARLHVRTLATPSLARLRGERWTRAGRSRPRSLSWGRQMSERHAWSSGDETRHALHLLSASRRPGGSGWEHDRGGEADEPSRSTKSCGCPPLASARRPGPAKRGPSSWESSSRGSKGQTFGDATLDPREVEFMCVGLTKPSRPGCAGSSRGSLCRMGRVQSGRASWCVSTPRHTRRYLATKARSLADATTENLTCCIPVAGQKDECGRGQGHDADLGHGRCKHSCAHSPPPIRRTSSPILLLTDVGLAPHGLSGGAGQERFRSMAPMYYR